MVALFASTLLVSATLLFFIEPMVAKMLLPLLGGVPAVWNTCLVFFQATLLAGYLFSHATLRWLGPRKQAVVQVLLVAGALGVQPIAVDAARAARLEHLGPVAQVLLLLLASAGPPFFALSTMAPTLQRWFSATRARGARDPYFLYAASNLGSLGALLAYPLLVEPFLGLPAQSSLLRWAYVLLCGLVGACAVATWKQRAEQDTAGESSSKAPPVSWRRRARWTVLAMVPSAYLVALTEHITTDIAPAPLLWVLPLATYLATFVVVFASKPPIAHARVVRVLPMAMVLVTFVVASGAADPAFIVVLLHLAGFFVAGLFCHGELAADRPEPARLAEFYVWMSVGGLLGGLAVAMVAPALFPRPIELPLAVVATVLCGRWGTTTGSSKRDRAFDVALPAGTLAITLVVAWGARRTGAGMRWQLLLPAIPLLLAYGARGRPGRLAASLGAVLAGATLFPSPVGDVLDRERNFFGALAVAHDPSGRFVQIMHGYTDHGRQSVDPAKRREASSYYTASSPIADVLGLYRKAETPRKVAVIGLGAGALAVYARPEDHWTFFEINPAVVRIAENPRYFTFLADAFPRGPDIVLGDARLELARHAGGFGLLIIDAFNSDAIPVHLVTVEAARLYASRMAPGGIIAWHISNRTLDLHPVLAELAAALGWDALRRDDLLLTRKERLEGKTASQWVAMAKDPHTLEDSASSAGVDVGAAAAKEGLPAVDRRAVVAGQRDPLEGAGGVSAEPRRVDGRRPLRA